MFIDNISKSTRKKYGKSVGLFPENTTKRSMEKVCWYYSKKHNNNKKKKVRKKSVDIIPKSTTKWSTEKSVDIIPQSTAKRSTEKKQKIKTKIFLRQDNISKNLFILRNGHINIYRSRNLSNLISKLSPPLLTSDLNPTHIHSGITLKLSYRS